MGFQPAGLAIRFLLELSALASFGYWAWESWPSSLRWVGVVAAPLLAAVLWGVFATPGDPSRSGGTVIATPGALRLVLELAVFFGAAYAVYSTGARTAGIALVVVLVIYHLAAIDRVMWLLRH
ncbi:YrdB family protein [Kitasatospora azatica]|uniref:YrdB family protein n=1 Tax=Kitasatospora azatica TaxID=58347 RepID=UPI000565D8F5|nr:YrdB family protein [Kitasatospora azatica]